MSYHEDINALLKFWGGMPFHRVVLLGCGIMAAIACALSDNPTFTNTFILCMMWFMIDTDLEEIKTKLEKKHAR